jgi:hypothetical protein
VALSLETVQGAVFGAAADLNESLPQDRRVPITGSTDIISALDSLGALNLLLRIEERLSDVSGEPCDLTQGELYEGTLFGSPTLDELTRAVHAALNGSAT